MLRLLLDEHIAKALSKQLASWESEIPIVALQNWENGDYLGAEDDVILAAAAKEGLTLVTYDQRTIIPLLKEWGEQGISHAGVIFVDSHTIAQNNIGELMRSLTRLRRKLGDAEWADRVVFLESAE